jgi:hypothetical protein
MFDEMNAPVSPDDAANDDSSTPTPAAEPTVTEPAAKPVEPEEGAEPATTPAETAPAAEPDSASSETTPNQEPVEDMPIEGEKKPDETIIE